MFLNPFSSRLGGYFAIVLLVVIVLLLGILQFRWLGQLSAQDEARRRDALAVASENAAAYVTREVELLLARSRAAASLGDLIGEPSLLEAAFAFDPAAGPRVRESRDAMWRPATWAQTQQALGGPLARLAAAGTAGNGLWLYPPAVVVCRGRCEVAVMSRERLVQRLLAPTMRRSFADLDDEIAVRVVARGPDVDAELFRSGATRREFALTDLGANILPGVAVAGPPATQWRLEANHGGTSLEAAVGRSRIRNVMLSVGLLTLLALSIGLVVSNARRRSALAAEQLNFVAAVSHELRTPLTVISTAAENLADATVDDPQRTRSYGELIHSEVRKLGSMIENVLQFAQAASSARPRVQASLVVSDLVEAALDAQRATLGDSELRIDVPVDLPTVRGDAAALTSLLGNLLTNAARYSEGGHWIEVRARCVQVRPRGRALRIDVTNPVGRLGSDPSRFFEPFFRGANARRTGRPGTGIGLAVVRHVARQHGGGVRVQSATRGQITFTLFLPVDDTA